MRTKSPLTNSNERSQMSVSGKAMEYVTFKAGDEYLGIEARYIHRVVEEVNVIPVPLVPTCYMGLMYYRGEVFDVVHAGSLLGNSKATARETTRIIVLKWSNKKLAVVPDHIAGIRRVEDYKRGKASFRFQDYTMRIVTPEEIWEKVSGLSYGPHKV
jgi:chemotaxis-related protein WspB